LRAKGKLTTSQRGWFSRGWFLCALLERICPAKSRFSDDMICSAHAFCKLEGPSLYFELTETGTICLISLPACSLSLVTQYSRWHLCSHRRRYYSRSFPPFPSANDRPRASRAWRSCLMAFGPIPCSFLTSASLSLVNCSSRQ